jgi:hypothetical protein
VASNIEIDNRITNEGDTVDEDDTIGEDDASFGAELGADTSARQSSERRTADKRKTL